MSNSKVYISALTAPKNGNTTMLRAELRQELEKSAFTASGKVGFLLAGATGPNGIVAPNVEKRVCWENISLENIAKYKLAVGSILEVAFKMPCRIKILETTEPQYDGHAPKINPTTDEVLKTAEGKSIYRTSTLTFDPQEQGVAGDKLVAHVSTGANKLSTAQPSTVFNSVEKIGS